jgi:Domain of unknown function (DUF397)
MDRDDVITPWRKSSYSNSGANCVEIARTRGGKVAVRDSKNPGGGALTFSRSEWRAFLAQIISTPSESRTRAGAHPTGGSSLNAATE